MPKKRNAGKLPVYDPQELGRIAEDLHDRLKAKLSLKDLIDLEKQLRREKQADQIAATELAIHICLRILGDRYRFGIKRKTAFLDLVKEYYEDVGAGRLTLGELKRTQETDGLDLNFVEV